MTQEQTIIQDTLDFLARRRGQTAGGDFFAELVAHLAETLDVAYAFVDKAADDREGAVETIAAFANGEVKQNFAYDLRGTPCAHVFDGSYHCFAHRLQAQFPDDQTLVEMAAESYAGIPLWSRNQEPLGLIAVLDTKPCTDTALLETVLKLVELVASAELEQRLMSEELERTNRRFRDLAEASSDWFWETDADIRYTWLSPNFQQHTGLDPDWYLGQVRTVITAPEGAADAWNRHIETLKARKPFKNYVLWVNGPDGIIWIRSSGVPVFNNDGEFTGYRGTGMNITREVMERQHYERELRTAKEEAEYLNRAKSGFLANMSHDLRTPLNAIVGMAQMIEMRAFGELGSPKYEEYARDIALSGGYLVDLVNDILDMSRIEAGKVSLAPSQFAVRDVVNEALAIVAPAATEGCSAIETRIERDLPELNLDKKALRQILVNLLSNAVKFTPPNGNVELSASRVNGAGVCFSIADTGCGMPDDMVRRIGEPFLTSLNGYAQKENKQGSGLGLSIVKGLSCALGAEFSVNSEIGKGTRVTLSVGQSGA